MTPDPAVSVVSDGSQMLMPMSDAADDHMNQSQREREVAATGKWILPSLAASWCLQVFLQLSCETKVRSRMNGSIRVR